VISYFYIKWLRLGPPLHVYQFTMPYSYCIILLNPITQQMLRYVVQHLSSLVQTIYTRTKKNFVLIRSTSFKRKLQELFNAFLICKVHATLVHPTSIHLNNNSVILTKLFDAWKSHFFNIGVALSHSGRHFFMVASYIKVKSILLNLTKFQ